LGAYREYFAFGAGLTLDKRIERGPIAASIDWRRRRYHDSMARPTNSLRNGDEIALRLGVEREITPWLAVSAGFGYTRFLAPEAYNAHAKWSVSAGLLLTHDLFRLVPGRAAALSLSAALLFSGYGEANANIDPDVVRHDREWRPSATLDVPVIDDISLVGQFGANLRASTLPNYRYSNVYTMIGVALRF